MLTAEQAEELQQFYAAESGLVTQLGQAGWSQTAALRLLGIAASSWHYRAKPRARVADPKPHTQRAASQRLSDEEISAIIAALMDAFEAEKSVFQAYYEALDAGTPVASLKSWYRVAAAYLHGCRPFRRTRTHRACAMPQWSADAPMQVWSWDITALPGPYRGQNFSFYVTMDVFSRAIVAWRVEEHEEDTLAKEMFEIGFAEHGGHPDIVHSDRGASMTSKTLARLFNDLGVTGSKNRPRVSNDNPFSEALFKTAKYGYNYPRYFHTLEQARAWAAGFVQAYNQHHRHSSLEGHTPASLHDGSWIQIHHQRQAALDALYAANPQRYPRPPKARTPLAQTALNQKHTDDRLQTA